MTDMTVKTPWHLWVVGVVGLLWNGFGFFNYLMSATQGEAWYRQAGVSQAMIDYVAGMPTWTWAAWAVGVGGGVLGSLFLVMRRSLALWAFAASLIGVVGLTAYQKVLEPAPNAGSDFLPYIILVVAAFLVWHAWSMSKKGVLR